MVAQHTQSGQAEECTVSKMSANIEQAHEIIAEIWAKTSTRMTFHPERDVIMAVDKSGNNVFSPRIESLSEVREQCHTIIQELVKLEEKIKEADY